MSPRPKDPMYPGPKATKDPMFLRVIVPLAPVAVPYWRYEVMLLVCWDKNTPPPRHIDPEILVPCAPRRRCLLCQGGQEHSDNDTNLEHEGPDDNAEVFVHDGDTFRAAALIRRPLASSRYGAEGLMLVIDEDGAEAEDLGCRRYLAFGLSLIHSEGRGKDYELIDMDLLIRS